MIVTHNYYVDFLKAFNAFLLRVFDPKYLGTKALQKIEYNIGSKTLLRHKLYGNESYEYPNAIVDLQDIRVAEGISTISRNIYGLMPSVETALLCDNLNIGERVFVETQRYLLNLNVQINVETNADMFNFYHIVTNNLPMNYTFVDYTFYYFIDVTEFVKEWDFVNDDIFNVIKMPDPTQRDQVKYFSLLAVQPQLEIQSVTKYEDKENNRYYITFSIIAATQIPTQLYGNVRTRVDRIIIDVTTDYDAQTSYPILMDIDLNQYRSVKKGIVLTRDDIKEKFEKTTETDPDNNVEIENNKFIGYEIVVSGNLEGKLLSLYLNPDILNTNMPVTFIPLDNNTTVKYDKDSDSTHILITKTEAEILKKYFNNEQYKEENEENLELIQLLIN
jgi:hypothetical protein